MTMSRTAPPAISPDSLKCYLAVPVQGIRDKEKLYALLVYSLRQCGVQVLNPEIVQPPPRDLETLYAAPVIAYTNLTKIAEADFLLAETSCPSLGVGYEIAVAERTGIPVIAIHDTAHHKLSKMILGNSCPNIHVFQYREDTLERLVALAVKWMIRIRNRRQNNISRRLISHFADLAPIYDSTTEWRRHPLLLDWFNNNRGFGKVLLEIGSGTGIVAEAASRDADSVIRLDISEQMLRLNRFGERILADAELLPIKSNTIDNILIRQVLHYVDAGRVLNESRRVLRSNGRILIGQIVAPDDSVARWWLELRRITQPWQRTVYTIPHLVRTLEDVGFHVAKVDSFTLDRSDTWDTFVTNAPESSSLVREYINLVPSSIARSISIRTEDNRITYRQNWGLVMCQV